MLYPILEQLSVSVVIRASHTLTAPNSLNQTRNAVQFHFSLSGKYWWVSRAQSGIWILFLYHLGGQQPIPCCTQLPSHHFGVQSSLQWPHPEQKMPSMRLTLSEDGSSSGLSLFIPFPCLLKAMLRAASPSSVMPSIIFCLSCF